MLNRAKTWAAIALLATFVSGIVVGGAAAAAWAARPKPTPVRQTFSEALQSRLTLTASQHDSVDAVLKAYQPPLKSAWDKMNASYQLFLPAREAYHATRDSIFGVVRGRISAFLTPQQRLKYQEMNAHSDSVRRVREHRDDPSSRTHDTTRAHDSAATRAH